MYTEVRDVLISIDPGMTTGVIIARRDHSITGCKIIEAVCIPFEDRLAILHGLFCGWADQLDRVIIEDFVMTRDERIQRAQAGSIMPSSRIIGTVEGLLQHLGMIKRLTIQPNYVMHGIHISKAVIEQIGNVSHTNAAYRHLRYALVQEKINHAANHPA